MIQALRENPSSWANGSGLLVVTFEHAQRSVSRNVGPEAPLSVLCWLLAKVLRRLFSNFADTSPFEVGWIVSPSKDMFPSQCPVSVKMTLFGNRAFADVIELNAAVLDWGGPSIR